MEAVKSILSEFKNSFSSELMPTSIIFSVLAAACIMSLYMFAVYRLVSRKSLYNKSFNICITVLPFFIATIILSLQSNLVITLGTIGALAIIRFRTVVKDPVDMLYVLWAVHIGITCGCRLYELCVLTSLAATVVLFVLEKCGLAKNQYVLVVQCRSDAEKNLLDAVSARAKNVRVKSRNVTAAGLNIVVRAYVPDPGALSAALSSADGIDRYSLIEYDGEDAL